MTTFATLCYIKKDNKILLQKKSKGLFGSGKWNAPGGKLKENELPEKCAVREVFEETGLRVNKLEKIGKLIFYTDENETPCWIVYVFLTTDFSRKLKNNYFEGELKWFDEDNLPYDEMWEDDRIWVPLLLKRKKFVGRFYFSEKFEKMIDYKIDVAH
ncbi:MAG: 8-oxo-dGTP diphosphatase [Candidatus Thermoplasmatota archaeon]|nr:8-oxo-dGTP diphosphatase [Candidatus Thermoplasmatota archaeon]